MNTHWKPSITFLNHLFVSFCSYSQVFQQALHRQPNTAAQYLQQMYAAQQQHLMLQTAALQQQHNLSTAQLQSLAAVQQVSPQPSHQRIILTDAQMITNDVIVDLLQDIFQEIVHFSVSPLSCLCERPVSQLVGKALHRTALHLSKQDPLRLR